MEEREGPSDPSSLAAILGGLDATRRTVVTALLAAAGVLASPRSGLAAVLGRAPPLPAPGDTTAAPARGARLRTRVIRPDDFLYFWIDYDNIATQGNPPTALVRVDPNAPAYLIVSFQPQAIADQAFQEIKADQTSMPGRTGASLTQQVGVEPTNIPPQVAEARIAGESRIVFLMPQVKSVPYTLRSLLEAMATWEMSLDIAAQPSPAVPLQHAALVTGPVAATTAASGVQAHLDHILSIMVANVGADQQTALQQAARRVFPVISQQAATAAARGQPLSGAQLDAMISQAFKYGVLQAAPTTTSGQPITSVVPALGKPHEPAPNVTAIELPYRLIQSPTASAGWAHATDPIAHAEHTELWHTRLGARLSASLAAAPGGRTVDDTTPQPIRAIWSPDYPLEPPPDTFTMSLDGLDRQKLVRLMAGYDEYQGNFRNVTGRTPFVPTPATAERLMLTALGGWLLEDGEWPQGPFIDPDFPKRGAVDITAWDHRAAMGRDYSVRVVYAGYLFPFGHAASLVKVTERKFEDRIDKQGRLAVLRQRFFIVVRQRTRTYQVAGQAFGGRDLPFTRLDILTKTTPDIADPATDAIDPLPQMAHEAFWPKVAGSQATDFQFQMLGFDHANQAIPFTSPAMFVSKSRTLDAAQLSAVVANHKGHPERRTRPFNGATIQMAPNDGPPDQGDTNVPTDYISFVGAVAVGAVQGSAAEPDPAPFFPGTDSLGVRLVAVQKLLGTDQPVPAVMSTVFVGKASDALGAAGFDATNPGQVFLDLVKAPNTLDLGAVSDKGGGLLSPALVPQSLSRNLGAVAASALDTAAFPSLTTYNPLNFLSDMNLLGVLPLKDILNTVADIKDAPKLINKELPESIEASFVISETNLKESGVFLPNDGAPSVLNITSVAIVPRPKVNASTSGVSVTPPTPTATIKGNLNNFKINLFGCITIAFDRLGFVSNPGKKPDVIIGINKDHGIVFGGQLEFVNKLKDYIPKNGFSDPPNVAVTPAGITASFSLALPSISVGILALQNVMIGAGFDLPFDGAAPSARFNFSERHNPFNLTVAFLGGGGFFAITVSTAGVQEIEAQLEFGAYAAINLGVAAGSVYIKAGIYFHWKDDVKQVDIEAFVELGGHLSILGLITVSLVFHVDLGYHKKGNQATLIGQATLTVDVEVLFFSKSVQVSVEKEFAGSEDPRFTDFIPDADTWKTYCSAFG